MVRTEKNPIRLDELAKVIAAEPSFITARLLSEAENRHKQLGLPLPPVLKDWENQLQRNAVANSILKGRDPKEFLPDSKGFRWIRDSQLLIKTPEGYALVSKTKVMLMIAASCDSIATALPQGIAAKVQLLPTKSDQLPEFAFDSGVPPVRFVVDDLSALDRNSNLRRGFFIAFLIVAAGLSGAGLVVLLRSVSRERELAERKGNLIAAVSHEMRTPVASIRLLTENLSTGAANTEERRASHLGQLLEQSERLSTLVENVLNYSKRVSGRAEWKISPIDVDKLLQNAATQFKALAESRKVSLRWRPCEFSTPAVGDTNALEQALANLIDNALKQSPPDSELSFGASPNSNRLEGWCLWVSDAGPGVPKEERKKIFEAFYRVGPELRRETKGTGLGLALVQQVAQAHCGEALCLASKSGGARFEIHLPYSPPNND